MFFISVANLDAGGFGDGDEVVGVEFLRVELGGEFAVLGAARGRERRFMMVLRGLDVESECIARGRGAKFSAPGCEFGLEVAFSRTCL